MAHAARLNLRMQKELKLLVTDPPHGVSLPLLSDNDNTSLSTIDARIQGPEGTVYAKGVFHIKIQIPERYPFQPPIVTFSTPIYHPNIDNGGRICLDILNLPPKGAWQPSLNISTVLTSIGLLLSEPNPDDGLMCDASREYKYNKQAFDQKARSWTERFAMSGAGGSTSGGSLLSQSMLAVEQGELDLKNTVEYERSRKKQRGMSSKLSLDSSVPLERRNNDNKENVAPNDNKENAVPIRRLSLMNTQRLPQSVSMNSAKSSQLTPARHHNEQEPQNNKQDANASLKQMEQLSEIPTMVIVSDSEESEEEDKGSTRPRLSLARKRFSGKWKTKACN